MIYTNVSVISVNTNSVSVQISGQEITVFLPSVISRIPVVGDKIVFYKDNVDSNGFFICYHNEIPVVSASGEHVHQLLADSIVDNMALSSSQKEDMRTKRTGGVK